MQCSRQFIVSLSWISQLSLGNFVTVDDKLQDLLVFISENLGSSSNSIKHEVEYDEQTGTWSTSGFLNKENDRRVQLEISVYDPDGEQIQLLEFSDTKDGKFNTFWIDKVDPGLYATVLNWQGVTSIKITHVQDPNSYDASYDDPHLSIASEKYETLKIFLQEFGGSQYTANSATFVEIEKDIEEAIQFVEIEKVTSRKCMIVDTCHVQSLLEVDYDSSTMKLSHQHIQTVYPLWPLKVQPCRLNCKYPRTNPR